MFDIDNLFNAFITNHNEKVDLYLDKFVIVLVFINDSNPHFKTDLYHKTSFINLKR